MCAYTLLAFAGVGPGDPWSSATADRSAPSRLIGFSLEKYGKSYRENTRESIRKQAIQFFVNGGILSLNPDDPALPVNSAKTHYRLTAEALAAIRAFGTAEWERARDQFRAEAVGGALAARYAQAREMLKIPVDLPSGQTLTLSPGAHNELQASIVQEFLPRFAGGARLLYLGDTANKSLVVDVPRLAAIGIPTLDHGKLPDVVAFVEAKRWLFLIEAVTTVGPMSPKRIEELQILLKDCAEGKVFVTAFQDFATFRRFAPDIAWDTEVWIEEAPDHLLHYNGDRFLGPR